LLLAFCLLGSVSLSVGLLLGAVPAAAAALCLVAGLSLAAAGIVATRLDVLRSPADPADVSRFRQLGEHLERGIERLKDLQWELSDTEARYRDLLDTQVDIIVRRDTQDRLTFVNRAFCRTFGVEASAVLGTPYALEVLEQVGAPAVSLRESVRRQRFEQQLQTVDGPRWFAFEHLAIAGEDGAVREVQMIGRDVTEERRTQAALAEARDQAEAANRAKSRFLAAMSHEIRTPMNGILGMTSLMLETPLTPEQRSYVSAVDHSAKNLLTIIDEILDLSKIEAGKLEMHPAHFHLDECVQSVVELLAPRAREKQLDLAWRVEPELPRTVIGDETRVRQVLLNLIGNAVKFTDHGGIAVRVLRDDPMEPFAGRSDDRVGLLIKVTDTGAGIPAERLPVLFSEFEQADDVVRRKRSGTGLGLAISRRLARAMDGDITVESSAGTGSTFTVRIVLRAEGAGRAVLCVPVASRPRLVLIVSRRILQREIMQETLLSIGIASEVATPESALAAIDGARRGGLPFDALLADMEEGPEAAGKLVGVARAAAAVPLRAVLVVDQPGGARLEEYRAAGFESYLVRPVRPASLLSQLDRTRRVPPPARPAEPSHSGDGTAEARTHARRILLVEDNDINALLARRMSEKAGCSVHHAPSGPSALHYCEQVLASDDGSIDVVLMDIHMPEMDGIEATRRIKRLYAGQGLAPPPIVALTANAFPEDRKRCLDGGLDDYLAKPFDRSELEALLDRWCPAEASSRSGRIGGKAA
jgi:PAS domain S-box-containing protein